VNKLIFQPISSGGWPDYALLDCGNQRKLERFGALILDRFEPDANWSPALNTRVWNKANFRFDNNQSKNAGSWIKVNDGPRNWSISVDEYRIALKLSHSRHIGIFPEQYANWRWLYDQIKQSEKPIKILNLFAYTGVASIICASAGAQVTHVDAAKTPITMARESQKLSGLQSAPIRWIIDDVNKFVRREIRRNNHYHGIIMDPPLFGRGPKGEIWKFDQCISEFLELLDPLFFENGIFFLLTAYNIKQKQDFLAHLVNKTLGKFNQSIEYGPLIQLEQSAGRELQQAEYVRCSRRA